MGRFKTATQETYGYLYIYLNTSDVSNDPFSYEGNWKKITVSESLFQFTNYLFSSGTAPTNKLNDGIQVTHF